MTDWAAIIVAVSGLMGTLGGAVSWLWLKLERRLTRLEADVRQCEDKRGIQLTVIELLWAELKRLAPDTPIFDRAKRLLDDLKNSSH